MHKLKWLADHAYVGLFVLAVVCLDETRRDKKDRGDALNGKSCIMVAENGLGNLAEPFRLDVSSLLLAWKQANS